jgi:ADP-ribose pyrophosphatase YjhB (NUDIX family)
MRRLFQIAKTLLGVILHHPITGTSIIPLLEDGRIVLVKRRDNQAWGLPGGIVDWGETIETAARRELAEETGLEWEHLQRLVGVYSAVDRDPRMHSICVVVAASVRGDFGVRDTLEIADVRAFKREELPLGSLSHDHDRQLQDYLDGETILA